MTMNTNINMNMSLNMKKIPKSIIRAACWLLLACAPMAGAITPFVITDIRVEGLQRLEEGTVFNYLPLKVGDEVDDEETRLSIGELFSTGFFKDVALERDGTTLVVKVVERPSLAEVVIAGNQELATELIQQGLEQAGFVEGRIFNQSVLNQVIQEIKDAYLALGRYSASVEAETESLDNNRVSLTLNIQEGRVARIKKINIIGVEKESVKDLKGEMELKDKRGFRPFSRRDQYSKQQLEADLEAIRSFYLNLGYYEFDIVSSGVDISSNKQNIFINISIHEGELFTFGLTSLEGIEEDQRAELTNWQLETGKPFSRKAVSVVRGSLAEQFSSQGFAFVDVRPVFDANHDEKVIDTVFTIILKQPVYVRRIDIVGNHYTRDAVIRRELRQFEGAKYSSDALARSKDRLQRLGIFESVTIETPEVPGTTDQIDVKVTVVERDTGFILFSAGYSDEDGALFGFEFEQRNLFGGGKDLSLKVNKTDAVSEIEMAFTNPYLTPSGISRKISINSGETDAAQLNTAEYVLDTRALAVLYKIPIAETNSINLGVAYEKIGLEATSSTPAEFALIVEAQPKAENTVLTFGVSKDSRDDFFFPKRGTTASVGLELSAPGSDFEYYKLLLQGANYYPMTDSITLKSSLGLGVGGSFGDSKEIGLPFFKNFFAGGARSVRGYRARTLGPVNNGFNAAGTSITQNPIGGDTRVLLNMESLFPPFGGGGAGAADKRLGLFLDGGMVYGKDEPVELGDVRFSSGVLFNWFSPIGPFSLSYAFPFNNETIDETEQFQVSIGTIFR